LWGCKPPSKSRARKKTKKLDETLDTLPILGIIRAYQGESKMNDIEKLLENDDWMMDPTAVDAWDCDDDGDDGQPDEYTEWQDLYGGDDWDHGQFDGDF